MATGTQVGQNPSKITSQNAAFNQNMAGNPASSVALAAAAGAKLARIRASANWFYWIAGLSLVNSLMNVAGNHSRFVIGLGITHVVDLLAHRGNAAGAAVVVNAFIAGLFVLFGVLASRRSTGAFVVGMALYAGDALLLASLGMWMSVAFHGLALYFLYRGYAAIEQLKNCAEFSQTSAR